MLVLSRKKQESVYIGDAIEVVVVDVRGDRVKLGFNAPLEVSIQRAELRERLIREQLDEHSAADGATATGSLAFTRDRDRDLGSWLPTREPT